MSAAPALPPLPGPVRSRVLELSLGAFAELRPDEVPGSLRAVAKFAPAKRAKLGGGQLLAALDTDERFRSLIAAQVRSQAAALAEAVESGVPSAGASDPDELAAAAFLLRPEGWQRYVEAAASARATSFDVNGARERQRLEEQLTGERERARADRERWKAHIDDLKAEVSTLRRTLRSTRDELVAAREARGAAETARDVTATEAAASVSSAESEARRLRVRVAELEATLESARRSAREGRSIEDTRLRLLLDTILDGAAGLRRELALPPVDVRPADLVAAVRPDGSPEPAARAQSSDDPRLLDALLGLPQVHLVVDGYNVTKTGFGSLSLEDQRHRLVTGLGGIAAQTGAEVTVCFDGAALDGRVPVPGARGVRVLFSAAGETADELIRRLVRAEPPGRPVVVVSSDREVIDGVKASGARPVAAMALVRRLARS
ncbi:MAG: NYN domain-containing protein [Actinomycetales bacterium]